jgi:hypothetical protein
MPRHKLIAILGQPENAQRMNDAEWNAVIRAARQTDLLGQLGGTIYDVMPPENIPPPVKRAIDLEILTARRRGEAALWEIRVMRRLIPDDIPIIVLKGCAYVLANDKNATGRLFSDIDLLVDAEHLGRVESALISGGWKPSQVSAYDQKYYRNWMHEVPPMEHVRRHTTVDLHHAIIPPVSRFAFDPKQLQTSAVEVLPGLFVLSPADRCLHSVAHAFLEGVSAKALRDLYDIACLTRQHFPNQSGRDELLARANQLGLEVILAAALEASDALYGSDGESRSPESIRARCLALAAQNAIKPTTVLGSVMEQLLLAHSHWMKMPIGLLVPHLVRKSWLRLFDRQAA